MNNELTLERIREAIATINEETKERFTVCADCFSRHGFSPSKTHKECSGSTFEVDKLGRVHAIILGRKQKESVMRIVNKW